MTNNLIECCRHAVCQSFVSFWSRLAQTILVGCPKLFPDISGYHQNKKEAYENHEIMVLMLVRSEPSQSWNLCMVDWGRVDQCLSNPEVTRYKHMTHEHC